MSSYIVITSDFDELYDELVAKHGLNSIRVFRSDELLIEQARAIIAEAYIAEVSEKIILVLANSYSVPAQNALLKILEEPPKNISFVLAAGAKSLFLPTIRSRLPVILKSRETLKEIELGLDFRTLTIKDILSFLERIESSERIGEIGKNELKTLISTIVNSAMAAGFSFSLKEYEYILKLIKLAELNTKSHALLTPILLLILKKGRV